MCNAHVRKKNCEILDPCSGKGIFVESLRKKFSNITSIEFDKKIDAHSDGDVGIHAVMDALLGAIGEGDIGEHFSPSDSRWKNIDSREMLKIVKHLLVKKGAKILNIDVTIMCERPKVLKFKNQMKEELAQVLGIAKHRVNIKATTTEKLGFLGRGEGIAAQAVASIWMTVTEE